MRFASSSLVFALLLSLGALGLPPGDAGPSEPEITPPVPYKLFVGATPENKRGESGAERIRNVFSAKNAGKKWAQSWARWFTLVGSREEAEIIVVVENRGFDSKPGYETMYYITGRLTIPGMIDDSGIRGNDTSGTFSDSHEELDLLRRIVRYLSEGHRAAVLAHTGPAAVSPAPPPKAEAPTPSGPEVDDPLFVYWSQFRPGAWVVRKSEGTLTNETKETLKSVTQTVVVVEVAESGKAPRTKTINAKMKTNPGAKPWEESEEVIDVAGKSLSCRAQKSGDMSRWYCPDVPGGFAKFDWREHGKFVQRVWVTAWEGAR